MNPLPKVKRGKTSFHFAESWCQCLPTLTSAQPPPLGISTLSHNWPLPCVTCYIALWLLLPTLPPDLSLCDNMTNSPPKIEIQQATCPDSSFKEVVLILVSVWSSGIISIFTCIVPIIFWFILIQTTKEAAIATWHVSTIAQCDGWCKLRLVRPKY